MFDKRHMETLEKRCEGLKSDNKQLHARIKELENELNNLRPVVEAADKYEEQHRLAMRVLAQSKDRYDLAYKEILKLKKEYEKRMENVLKGFE